MVKKFKYLFFFLFAVILTIGSGLVSNYLQDSSKQNNKNVIIFKKTLENESLILRNELNDFKKKVQKYNFNELRVRTLNHYNNLEKTGKSFFVVNKKEMLFWTSNRVNVPIDLTTKSGICFFGNAWYLVQTIDLPNFSLIATQVIKIQFENENSYLTNHFNSPFSLSNEWGLSNSLIQNAQSYLIQNVNNNRVYLNCSSNSISEINFVFLFIELIGLIFLFYVPFFFCEKWKGMFSIFYLFFLRIVLFFSDFPINCKQLKLFQPELYAASDWIPSFGDLILHFIFLSLIFLIVYRNKNRIVPFINPLVKFFTSLGLVLILGICLALSIESLIVNSKIFFDLSDISNLSIYTFISLSFVLIANVLYSVLSYKLIEVVYNLYFIKGFFVFFLLLLVGFLILSNFVSIWMSFWLFIVLLFLGFKIYRKKSFQYLNFIPEIVVVAFFLSLIFNQHIDEQETKNLKQLIQNQAEERDPIAEFLFTKLVQDLIVYSPKDSLGYIIFLEKSLPKYLQKFNFTIHQHSLDNYNESSEFLLGESEAISPNLYHFKNKNFNSYSLKIPFGKSELILINFKEKQLLESTGFPLLLLDKSVESKVLDYQYSFAKYSNGKLKDQNGTFNYSWSQSFFPKLKNGDFLDFNMYGFRHYLYQNQSSLFVITQKEKVYLLELSNFSYLLFFFIILIFSGNIFYRIYFKKGIIVNDFKSRFQLSLIFTLFFSMALIAWASIYNLKHQFNYKNFDSISEKIKSVQINLIKQINNTDQIITTQQAELILNDLSSTFFTDINLFDAKGKLITTSQKKIFESDLISKQMHPNAFYEMNINNKMQFVQEEHIEKMTFLSAYAPLYHKNGNVLAYINLPYFTKTREFKNEINGFLLTLVNIYFLLTLLTMFLTLLIANRITAPLRMIKDKISKISILKTNELIEWNGKDELGGLIQEYNKKVKELSENALKLAQAEREGAWKEMAKQVAHEIKNPLTPMKLNIQHFQMLWSQLNEQEKNERFTVFSKNLMEQIDTLTAIASQFSNFATLPEAKINAIDLIPLLQSSLGVYEGTESIKIIFKTELKIANILADKNQIIRVFNNLIKNAIQAIPDDKKGELIVCLNSIDNNFTIAFKDNGTGIPSEIQEKIFQPNFTTKTSGMGLGLAMVKRLVENNNGQIWFETQLDIGTTFYLNFKQA